MENPEITVVLNVYKRSEIFEQQLRAVRNQSIPPSEILVWENGTERVPNEFREDLIITRAGKNFGVWARFAYALNAKGEFVCIFDDDTIPGERWLENCLATMKLSPGLLGTRGVIFDSPHAYSMHVDVGVHEANLITKQVDIVGHSWFFKKSWLAQFWGSFDMRFPEDIAGEDIHFSFAMQKYLNLPTLVPPHPPSDLTLWGSNPELARRFGSGEEAISRSSESLKRFENALQHYRKLGFKTMSEIGDYKSRYPKIVYLFIRQFPQTSHNLAKFVKSVRTK
jgi:glycosyltransferase involved in cell wall biosynthesis